MSVVYAGPRVLSVCRVFIFKDTGVQWRCSAYRSNRPSVSHLLVVNTPSSHPPTIFSRSRAKAKSWIFDYTPVNSTNHNGHARFKSRARVSLTCPQFYLTNYKLF